MFSELVVGYLFCGGTGAGMCAVLAVLGLLAPAGRVTATLVSATGRRTVVVFRAPEAYRKLMAPAFCAALALLVVSVLFLVADLGRSDRAQLLFAYPTPTFLTVGAFSLVALIAVALMLAVAWGNPASRWRRWGVAVLHWLALALGLVVAVYTGLLLASMQAVPFWSSAWVPVLFAVSALSCGCAAVIGCACLAGSFTAFGEVMARVRRADAALLALEALVLVGLIASAMGNPYEVAQDAAWALVSGEKSALFYGAVVAVGIALPLALGLWSLARRERSAQVALSASACVLVGGVALRLCVVAAGAHPQVWVLLS